MGHPASTIIGVTEAEFKVRRCSLAITSQGFDGLAIPVDQYFAVRGTVAGLPLLSNMSFYSSSCTWIATKYAKDSNPVASPSGSAWVVVSYLQGRNIHLDWKTCSNYTFCKF